MKKHLLILSFLLGALMTQAAPRSLSEMMEAAKKKRYRYGQAPYR